MPDTEPDGPPLRPTRVVVPALPGRLAVLRRQLQRWLAPLQLPEEDAVALQMAVGEAVENAVEHAYRCTEQPGTVDVALWADAGAVCVEVTDHGRWRPPPPRRGYRGRGIPMMLASVSEVSIEHRGDGTTVLLRHRLAR